MTASGLINKGMAGVLKAGYIPPDDESIYGQIDYDRERINRAPRRRPGDRFPVVGALVGLVVGLVFSLRTRNLSLIVICTIGGGVAGAIIGSFIGYIVLRIQKSRRDRVIGDREYLSNE